MVDRMPLADYEDMKKRLREMLQQWGMWTNEELDKVAQFVEREVVRVQSKPAPVESWTERPMAAPMSPSAKKFGYSSAAREKEVEAILTSASEEPMSSLLHPLWTKAVGAPDYVKVEWQILESVLYRMQRLLREKE